MGSYFRATIDGTFADALDRVRDALQAEGFGVISEIDIQKTPKEKIGAKFRPYRILGACNPALAFEALQLEDEVGTMLPCNVVVQQTPDGGRNRSNRSCRIDAGDREQATRGEGSSDRRQAAACR